MVVLLELWHLPWLPIMLMPAVDQDAISNQATFVVNQKVGQSSSEHQCDESVLVLEPVEPMQADQPSLHCHGGGQYSTCCRSWQVDGLLPHVDRQIFCACLSRAPRLGLSAVFGLPSNRGRSSRQCMASGIRKIISSCSYVDLGTNKYAWKTNRENPSLGTNSKLGTPKQLFLLALGPLWRSC